ncbi:MAG: tRNA (adenosine(37)-N6)-dimethylallyltransferase MiaA [Acidimicrobiales bacterium]
MAVHVALVGTTASGKSALALEVARRHRDLELVSFDSMQVYRGMDIGTAKPTSAERSEVPHHLIDLVDPDAEFTVAEFRSAGEAALADIEGRRRRALLVGGTGLYLRAVLDRLEIPGQYPGVRDDLDREPDTEALHRRLATLDPLAASRMEATNRRRVVRALEVTIGAGRPFSSFGPGLTRYAPTDHLVVGVALPAPVVAARIEARYRRQLESGFVDEVRRLAARPGGLSRTARQALGYRELLTHVEDGLDLERAVDLAVRRTRQFARRQRAWFRRDPRIRWLEAADDPMEVLPGLLGLIERHQTGATCD